MKNRKTIEKMKLLYIKIQLGRIILYFLLFRWDYLIMKNMKYEDKNTERMKRMFIKINKHEN